MAAMVSAVDFNSVDLWLKI